MEMLYPDLRRTLLKPALTAAVCLSTQFHVLNTCEVHRGSGAKFIHAKFLRSTSEIDIILALLNLKIHIVYEKAQSMNTITLDLPAT